MFQKYSKVPDAQCCYDLLSTFCFFFPHAYHLKWHSMCPQPCLLVIAIQCTVCVMYFTKCILVVWLFYVLFIYLLCSPGLDLLQYITMSYSKWGMLHCAPHLAWSTFVYLQCPHSTLAAHQPHQLHTPHHTAAPTWQWTTLCPVGRVHWYG